MWCNVRNSNPTPCDAIRHPRVKLHNYEPSVTPPPKLSIIRLSLKDNLLFVCYRLHAVVIAENGEYDIHDHKLPLDGHSLRRETPSYDSVQEYVNSLPHTFNRTASMMSLHSLHLTRNRSQENLLKKSSSLRTSFSMEDLLFVG